MYLVFKLETVCFFIHVMYIHVINWLTSIAFPIELNKKEIDVIIVPSGDYCVVSFLCSDSEFLIWWQCFVEKLVEKMIHIKINIFKFCKTSKNACTTWSGFTIMQHWFRNIYRILNCLLFQVHEPKQKVDLTKYLENHKFW